MKRCPQFIAVLLATASLGMADVPIRLQGIIQSTGITLVSLVSSNGYTKWCVAGDSLDNYVVQSIDIKNNTVTIKHADGSPEIIRLQDAKVTDAAAGIKKLTPLNELNWAWINSPSNPMRELPESLPLWTARNWDNMEANQKIDVLNYYRAHGWQVDTVKMEKNGYGLHVSTTKLKDPSLPQRMPEELRRDRKRAQRKIGP